MCNVRVFFLHLPATVIKTIIYLRKEDLLYVLHQNLPGFTFVSTFASTEACETGCGLLLIPRKIQLEVACLPFNSPDYMPQALRRPFLFLRKPCCRLVSLLHTAAELVSSKQFCMCTEWELYE